MAEFQTIQGRPPKQGQEVEVTSGLPIPQWDKVTQTQTATTDTWTFQNNGATVYTVVITYTDSTKATISNVTGTKA